jgi:hypothetical protein
MESRYWYVIRSHRGPRRHFVVVDTFAEIDHHAEEVNEVRMNRYPLDRHQQQYPAFVSHARDNTSDDSSFVEFDDIDDFDDCSFDADDGIDYRYDESMYQEEDVFLDVDDDDSNIDESLFHDADYEAEKYRYQKSLLSSSSSSSSSSSPLSSSRRICSNNVTSKVMDGTTTRRRPRSEFSLGWPMDDEFASSESPSSSIRRKTHDDYDDDVKDAYCSGEIYMDPTYSTCDLSVSANDDSDWW